MERSKDGEFATMTLNRPKVHNAFNDVVIARIGALCDELTSDVSFFLSYRFLHTNEIDVGGHNLMRCETRRIADLPLIH